MATKSHPHNPEPDYRSPPTRTPTNPSGMEDPTATQLDFYQAMADFKHMFPDMDEEVIEAVLRSNNGGVDATIDQLLTMNTDCVASTGRQRKEKGIPPKYPPQAPKSAGNSSADTMAPPPYSAKASEPPPSYQEYARSLEQATQTAQDNPSRVPRNDSVTNYILDAPVPEAESDYNAVIANANDLLGAIGGVTYSLSETTPKLPLPKGDVAREEPSSAALDPPPAPMPQIPDKMPLFNHDYTPKHQLTPKRLYKNWNPPLLGRLPDDFLRISINTNECHHCHHLPQKHASPTTLPSPSTNTTPVQRSKAHRSHSRSSSQASSPRIGSCDGRSPRISPRNSRSEELNSEMIQQKMVENERKRSSFVGESDPATLQMLEDERMALMLQNEEFLTELMGDEDFMRTLERDHMNATAFEPPPQSQVEHPEEPELDPDRPKPEFIEGYGDDRDVTLSAFPFDRSMPKDKKAEFRRKLNNMGGSSKKKMVAAAKKFFSRKKKSPKQLLKENAAPSTANLLEEEEVFAVSPPGGGEPHSRSHVSYGDWYTY